MSSFVVRSHFYYLYIILYRVRAKGIITRNCDRKQAIDNEKTSLANEAN